MTAAQFDAELAKEREKRIQLLRATRAQLSLALTKFKPEKAKLSEIVAGVRMVTDELRREFNPAAAAEQPAADPEPVAAPVVTEPADPLRGLRLYRDAG